MRQGVRAGGIVWWAAAVALSLGACGGPPADTAGAAGATIAASTLGSVYLQEGRLAEAEAQFRKVIALAPRAASGYANLALVYLGTGDSRRAERAARQALERDSSDVTIHLLLAKITEQTGRPAEARAALERLAGRGVSDPRLLYALAELDGLALDSVPSPRRIEYLRRIADTLPGNAAVRLQLAGALFRRGDLDGAVQQLEELRRIVPEPPVEAERFWAAALRSLRAGRADLAQGPFEQFGHFLEITPAYQAALRAIQGPRGAQPGFPVVTFSPVLEVPLQDDRAVREAIRFRDATETAGLGAPPSPAAGPALAMGDYDGDGLDDLLSAGGLFRSDSGRFVETTRAAGLSLAGPATVAAFADYDNDGRLDLFLADGGRGRLFRNAGRARLREAGAAGITTPGEVRRALFADLDHDGDLDLFLTTATGNRWYRNNLDGTFLEMAGPAGLAGPGLSGRDAAFGDFDGDGRLDLFVATERGPNALYRNLGQSRFEDVATTSGLAAPRATGAVAAADFDNDGFLDLFLAGRDGTGAALYRNAGDGTFTPDHHAPDAMAAVRSLGASAAAALDYDNDGHLDLAVAGTPASPGGRALMLFRNDAAGGWEDVSAILPDSVGREVTALLATDYDQDGDVDLLLSGDQGFRVLRNDGGNVNQYVAIRLTALRTGSGKNNTQGIGARLELRAGDLYQTRVVTQRVTHFGLGRRLRMDVLRVEWPNGVPQVLSPGLGGDVMEQDVLKGSCAFAYAWNGERYELVTDLMWRSAIGMPLGILGRTTAYAPAGASTEYVRLPGALLQPRDGRYRLQLTEELWETAFVDEVKLLVVDHPDSVDLFVNERFVPPGPTPLRLYQARARRAPVSAVDQDGTDLLPALRARDDRYAATLTPGRFQGLAEPHDLILDLGPFPDAPGDSVFLYLNGWIYPTDASINVAVAQAGSLPSLPPLLQVRDAAGGWRTVLPDLGFPAGKRKTVIADLTGKFPTADHRVRIRTNLQVYWDEVFVAGSAGASPVRVTSLEPVAADLHYRGFSRTYRRGGRYGPQWFDYDEVSREPRWRPIEGAFTRYGDVRPLLLAAEDQYVIMGPGDETTVEFDAGRAPPLPSGWARDFLIYSDGWIKDSDLNTAAGTTVAPLPFHAMSRYPYGAEERYPATAAHREYLATYNTRVVDRRRR